MRFARWTALLLSVLICLGAFVSCNGGDEPKDTEGASTPVNSPAEPKPTAPGLEEVVIVYNTIGSDDYFELCKQLKNYFSETLGVNATTVIDYHYEYGPEEGKLDIFVGDPMHIDITGRL